jgi:dipeptidase E
MKLFLASSLDKTAKLLSKSTDTKEKTVLFIANASDITEGKWWVDADREAFKKIGCKINEIDLRSITKKDFSEELNNSDFIHFCGGSVLYLISLLRQKGFDKLIIDAIKKDEVIYTSSSAGSMIVAKDLSLCAFDMDEPDECKKKENYSGLDLVNFLILPHSNNKDFTDANLNMVKQLPNFAQPTIFLYDNQAVFVEGNTFKIVS